jgi:hypothetical protein
MAPGPAASWLIERFRDALAAGRDGEPHVPHTSSPGSIAQLPIRERPGEAHAAGTRNEHQIT